MATCTIEPTTPKTTRKAGDAPALLLAIGARGYRVRLDTWSADECRLIFLEDMATGQVTRVKDCDNVTKYDPARKHSPASCSCSPGRKSVECRHVRALRRVHLLPNDSRTEGEA